MRFYQNADYIGNNLIRSPNWEKKCLLFTTFRGTKERQETPTIKHVELGLVKEKR